MIKNSLKSPFLVLTKGHLCSRRKTKILLKERFYTQKQKNLKLDELNDENFLGEVVKRFCQHWLEEKMSSYLFSFLPTNGQKIKEAKEKLGILELLFPQDREEEFQSEHILWHQRSEKALVISLMKTCIDGILTPNYLPYHAACRRGKAGVQRSWTKLLFLLELGYERG